jgi:hypothetical protein
MGIKRIIVVTVLAVFSAAQAIAIIIRHDRDDAKYLELGSHFPAVCSIGRAGEGALISPEWIVTAAHVAKGSSSPTVDCNGVQYKIVAKFIFPDWQDMAPNDIGLIKLAKPVKEIDPLGIYDGKDETGKTVTFVGRGGTGTGLTGPTHEDRKRRGATSVVERADHEWLYFTFHDSSTATDLEGISGPGDSGGPALIEKEGKWYVAGISVWGQPGPKGRGTYGAKEGYTRVSSYLDWIHDTLQGKTKPLMAN